MEATVMIWLVLSGTCALAVLVIWGASAWVVVSVVVEHPLDSWQQGRYWQGMGISTLAVPFRQVGRRALREAEERLGLE